MVGCARIVYSGTRVWRFAKRSDSRGGSKDGNGSWQGSDAANRDTEASRRRARGTTRDVQETSGNGAGDLVGNIVKHLKKGERIRIGGLGILQVRRRAARMGRNPATGEAIQIKASKKVAFRASKELKEAI